MDIEAILGMLIGFGLVVGLPITAILVNHQRKMAELVHKQHMERSNSDSHRVRELENEVRELRELVHDMVIRSEDPPSLGGRGSRPLPPTPAEE